MEKQEVIKVLREKLALWDKIIPMMTQATTLAMQKGQVVDARDKNAKKSYTYNPDIKIKALPVDHAQLVQDDIDSRYFSDCKKKAQKKYKPLRILLTIVMLLALAITLVPHILNFVNGEMDCYMNFGKATGYQATGEAVDDLGLNRQTVTSVVLAGFSMLVQCATVFFVSMAAKASLKAKISSRVPGFARSLRGLWIALSIVVGIIALVTWILTEPIGLTAIALVIVFSIICNASAGKLPYAKYSYPTQEEAVRLEEAQKKDAQNQAANNQAIQDENEKARKKFVDAQKKYTKDCNEQIDQYEKEIDALTDDIATLMKQTKTELLSEKDNNRNTIEMLLNYLENGRADTLKEALYMVDMAKEREKDRETQREIARMQAETDRFMAQLKQDEDRRFNNELLAQQRAHNERVQREQSRHNSEVEAHNREVERELERIKNNLN